MSDSFKYFLNTVLKCLPFTMVPKEKISMTVICSIN